MVLEQKCQEAYEALEGDRAATDEERALTRRWDTPVIWICCDFKVERLNETSGGVYADGVLSR